MAYFTREGLGLLTRILTLLRAGKLQDLFSWKLLSGDRGLVRSALPHVHGEQVRVCTVSLVSINLQPEAGAGSQGARQVSNRQLDCGQAAAAVQLHSAVGRQGLAPAGNWGLSTGM